MADFVAVDQAAYGDARVLDTFLAKTARSNTEDTHKKRAKQGVWCAGSIFNDVHIRPRLCCYNERALVPYPWYLAPGVSTITAVVRHTVPSNVSGGVTEGTLSLTVVPLERALDEGFTGAPTGSGVATLSQQTSAVNTTLTVDVSQLGPGWVIVFLGWESALGSFSQIDEGTGKGNLVLAGWRYGFYEIASAQTTINVANLPDAPCWVVSPLDIAVVDDELRLPGTRQVLRMYENAITNNVEIDIWPPLDDVSSNYVGFGGLDSTSDALYYAELGYTDIRSVLISETIANYEDRRATYDAQQYTSATNAGILVGEQVQAWMQAGRIHRLGPHHSADGSSGDLLDNTIPRDKIGYATQIFTETSGDWRTLLRAEVGAGDTFSWDGVNRRRCRYRVFVLFGITVRTDKTGVSEFGIETRIRLTDVDGTGNLVTTEFGEDVVKAARVPKGGRYVDTYRNAAPWALLARYHADRNSERLAYHALKGVWPESAWGGQWYYQIVDVVDASTASLRRLRWDVRLVDSDDQDGTLLTKDTHIHLVSAKVFDAPDTGGPSAVPNGALLGPVA